jgi:hypothetical protein
VNPISVKKYQNVAFSEFAVSVKEGGLDSVSGAHIRGSAFSALLKPPL